MATTLQVSSKNFELCRTCMSKDTELYSVFDLCLGAIKLDFVISAITGVKIEQGDGLPTTVCRLCTEKAANAYDFRKKSQETDLTLRSVLKKNNLKCEARFLDVKLEQSNAETHDDFMEVDFNLPVVTDLEDIGKIISSSLSEIKNEAQNVSSHLQCKNCYLVLNSEDELKQHTCKKCIKIEFDEDSGTYCPLCGGRYDKAESLSNHMWKHHASLMTPKKRGRPRKKNNTISNEQPKDDSKFCFKSPKCPICKENLKTKETLKHFMVEHKDVKIYTCNLCKKMYLEKSNLDQHTCLITETLNSVHNDPKANTVLMKVDGLDNVKEVYLKELYQDEDMVKEVNKTLHLCDECGAVFPLESDLLNHIDYEHPEISQRCKLCSKVFTSVKFAARHRTICKHVEKKHTCDTCGLKFPYEISLNKHILRCHEGQSVSVKFIDSKTKLDEKQYQCDTCNRCFYRKDLLAKHTKMHMPNQKWFECDICSKKFYRKDSLRSHKRIHELQCDKNPKSNCLCLYCGRSFSNSSNLIVHMRRHTGEKPYKCDFCGKGFPRSSDLQCHRRSHTGEKPCICGVCGKGFSRSNKLSRHMRVHTGIRPYKCTYCEKAFSQSNDLNLHIRRHTGDKPYICDVCGDRFIQGTALQNHRRIHGHLPSATTNTRPQVQGLAYMVQTIPQNSR